MKSSKHKRFIDNHGISLEAAPVHLRELVKLYEDLFNLSVDCTPYLIGSIHKRLTYLDELIYSELLDEYQDKLKSNEVIETPVTDEMLLDKLIEEGNTEVTPSYLYSIGFKTKLRGDTVQIGNRTLLRKGFLHIRYKLL